MKLRSVRYLAGEGFKNVWANRMMSLASIGVLTACMFIMGVAIALTLNVDKAMSTLAQQNVVMVFFDDTLEEADAKAAAEKIGKIENVASSTFVSSKQGLQNQIDKMGDEYKDLFSLFDDDASFMPNSTMVKFVDLESFDSTIKAIEKVEGVESINDQREVAQKINTISKTVNVAGAWIIALLLIIALVIICNTIRITMYNRKLEISIMKAVGATDNFIRFPFLVEGMVIGLLASVVTTGLLYAVYRLAMTMLENAIGTSVIPYREFALPLFGIFAAIGVLVGLLGSLLIIGKYLKKEGSEFRAL